MTMNNFLVIIIGYLSLVQCIKLIPVRGHRPTDYQSVKKGLNRASELRARLNELVRDFSISDSNRLQVSALLRAHKLIENSLKVFDAEVTKTHMSMACPEGDDCVSNSLDFCRRIRLAIEDESSYFLTYMDQIISKGWVSISEPAVDSTEGAYVGLLSSFRSKEEVRLLFLHWYGVAQRQKQKQAEASQDSQSESETLLKKTKVLKSGNWSVVYFIIIILGGLSSLILYFGVNQNIFTSQKLKNSHRRKQLQKYFFTALRLFKKYGLIFISIMNDSLRLLTFFGESFIDNIRIVFQTIRNECSKSTQKQNYFGAKAAAKNNRKVIVKPTTVKKKTTAMTTTSTSSTAAAAAATMFTPVIPIDSLGHEDTNTTITGWSSTLEVEEEEVIERSFLLDDNISSGKSARSSPDTVARKSSMEEEIHDSIQEQQQQHQQQQQKQLQTLPSLLSSSVFLEYRADNEEEWLRKISTLSDEDWLLQDREGGNNEDEGWVTLLGTTTTGRNRGRGKKLSPSSSVDTTRKSTLSPSIEPYHHQQQQQSNNNRMHTTGENLNINNVNKNNKKLTTTTTTSTERRSRRRTKQATGIPSDMTTTTLTTTSLSHPISKNSSSGGSGGGSLSPKKQPLSTTTTTTTSSNSSHLPVVAATGQITTTSSFSSSSSPNLSDDQISIVITTLSTVTSIASPLSVTAVANSSLETKHKNSSKSSSLLPIMTTSTTTTEDNLTDRGSVDETNQTDCDSGSESPLPESLLLDQLSYDSKTTTAKTSSYHHPVHAFPPLPSSSSSPPPLVVPLPVNMSIVSSSSSSSPPTASSPSSLILSTTTNHNNKYHDHYDHYYHHQFSYHPDTTTTTDNMISSYQSYPLASSTTTYQEDYPYHPSLLLSEDNSSNSMMMSSGYYNTMLPPCPVPVPGMILPSSSSSSAYTEPPQLPSIYHPSQYTNHSNINNNNNNTNNNNNNNLIHVVRSQMEYYFSVDNLCRDIYLRSKMDSEGFVFLREIIQFNRMKIINAPLTLILEAVQSSSLIEVCLPWSAKVVPTTEPLFEEVILNTKLRCAHNWSQWIIMT